MSLAVPENLLFLRKVREKAEEEARLAATNEKRALNLYALEMSPFKVGERFTRGRRSWATSTPRVERWQVVAVAGLCGWRSGRDVDPGVTVVLHCVRVLANGSVGLQRTEIYGDLGQPRFFHDLKAEEDGE